MERYLIFNSKVLEICTFGDSDYSLQKMDAVEFSFKKYSNETVQLKQKLYKEFSLKDMITRDIGNIIVNLNIKNYIG